MKTRFYLSVASLILGSMFLAATSWSAVLPPPVNQNIGIPDSVFNQLAEADCRACHNQNPPPGIPVEPTYLPSRHHGLVDLTIPTGSVAPNGDPNGDGLYECASCHSFIFNPLTGAFDLDPEFRDCTICHVVTAVGPTVHHATTLAQDGFCSSCHNLVENPNDTFTTMAADPLNATIPNPGDPDAVPPVPPVFGAHYVPNYMPSMVTPYPSGKPNGDPSTNNNDNDGTLGGPFSGAEAGNCNYCHDADAANGTLENGVLVFTNMLTHHSTGLGIALPVTDPVTENQAQCAWCHNTLDPAPPMTGGVQFSSGLGYAVRACERCHSVATIHNIQVDSDNINNVGSIVPGLENAGYGHIGEQWDCWGCHGSDGVEMAAAPSGPTIPFITGVSASKLQAGVATQISLAGSAFTNELQNPMTGGYFTMKCDVLLTDAAGTETLLTADSVSVDSLVVTIPAVTAGNYTLVAKKYNTLSNPITLAVTPAVTIESVVCNGGDVAITGTGFSAYDGVSAVTKVSSTVTTQVIVGYEGRGKKQKPIYEDVTETVDAAILSWSDSQIGADFVDCPETIDVASVFGSASATIGGTTEPPVDPPAAVCSDYSDKSSCEDNDCNWNRRKNSCK